MFRIGLLLVIITCIALAITNPGEETHKKVVYGKASNEAGMKGLLGEVAGDVLVNLDLVPLEYNNYFLFSTTTFRDETVSIGFLNNVRATDWNGLAEEVQPFKTSGE